MQHAVAIGRLGLHGMEEESERQRLLLGRRRRKPAEQAIHIDTLQVIYKSWRCIGGIAHEKESRWGVQLKDKDCVKLQFPQKPC